MDNLKLADSSNLKIFQAGKKLEAESLFLTPYYPNSYVFPYNPDPLINSNDYSVYDEMRDDDQVKVALALKKDILLNSGYSIVCDDAEIKEFIEHTLEEIGSEDGFENGIDDVLRDITSSYDYGFALSEVIYASPAKTESGKWELANIKVRPPHSFIFQLDDKGTVIQVEQYTHRGMLKFKPSIFMHHVYQPEFGNPYGKSDLRAAHPAWKAKKFIFRMAMRYAERFAGAVAVGRYTPNMSPNEISALFTTLQTIQDNTTLVIPEEAKVELIQANRDSSNVYEAILHMLNMWIARAILIPDLLGVSGDKTSGGSFALGKEHFKVFLSSIRNDRLSLQRKITLKVIRPLVKANFGDIPCSFEFKPLEAGDEIDLMRLWVDAVNGRIFKPTEEEVNYFRRKTGFPEGVVELPEPINPNIAKPESTEKIKKEISQDNPQEKEMVKSFRKQNSYESKMDFATIEKILDISEDRAGREIILIAKRMAYDLFDQAKDRKIADKFRPEKINDLKPKFQREMNVALRGQFISLFKSALDEAKKEIYGNSSKKFTADDILPDEFEEVLRAKSFKIVKDITDGILKNATNVLYSGTVSGLGHNEMFDKFKEIFADKTDANIRTIIRTETTSIYNGARKTFFDTDEVAKEIIDGYMYSAILDDRTTAACRSLDGKIFNTKTDSDYIARITPAIHFNCRSLLIPVTRFEEKEFDEPIAIETLKEDGALFLSEATPAVERTDLIVSGNVDKTKDNNNDK